MARITRQDIGACPICTKALSKFTTHVTLKGSVKICRECENKLRVLYPLSYKTNKAGNIQRKDPINKITLEEAAAELDKVIPRIEEIRRQYGYNAVFKVDDISYLSNGWFRTPKMVAIGHTLIGMFDLKDQVRIIRKGKGTTAEIKGINRDHAKEKDILDWEHRAEAGYPCSMVFVQEGLTIAPGDLIVK